MKITPEDMDKIRDIIDGPLGNGAGAMPRGDDRDIALALILVSVWDRGHNEGYQEALRDREIADTWNIGECPYTFAHTREWCGYVGCREA